ncbi:flagellar transcriptional regulator FlhD [Trinickia violacea]|uniref:Flagellar transcriptional regulator FlhD n=1 Tax=Trinickia violacea TaxID=2571746 RepID=A0A4P8INM4_9BURK|nr:flagellar transcriptional regulator FlhD [Trinickia violacea]QCP49906.1 flagellar transcriptional regulator FlhD [Trinickia violacea]
MNFGDTLDSIREINFLYLSVAQRLLQADRAAGIACFGLSPEAADVIGALTLAQLTRLSASSQILCAFGQRSCAILAMLAHDGRNARDISGPAEVAANVPLPVAS